MSNETENTPDAGMRDPARIAFAVCCVAVAIVGIIGLGRLVLMPRTDAQGRVKTDVARGNLTAISAELRQFKADNGRYPTAEEGLRALVEKPPGDWPHWKQLATTIPLDPWGRAYLYKFSEAESPDFQVYSRGPDGFDDGGSGDDVSP